MVKKEKRILKFVFIVCSLAIGSVKNTLGNCTKNHINELRSGACVRLGYNLQTYNCLPFFPWKKRIK